MFEQAPVYYTNQNLSTVDNNQQFEATNDVVKSTFRSFIHQFTKENIRPYQTQVQKHIEQGKQFVNINLSDLKSFDQQLYQKFMATPLESLSTMEDALSDYVLEKDYNVIPDGETRTTKRWQVIINSDQNPRKLRELGNSLVGKMFVLNGIIVSCTKPFVKATMMRIQCKTCKHIKEIQLSPGQTPTIPRRCTAGPTSKTCQMDSFEIMPFGLMTDEQKMKIQENAQDIPTGQIPRSIGLVSCGYNVDKCVPGDKVRVTGIMMVQDIKAQSLGYSYIYVTGIQKIKERLSVQYTQQEEESFKKMAKDPKIYEKLFKSIAPGIYGSEDIKKAIACMLFGGSSKRLPDGTTLRADINILLIGDPSTAKSQFLKFV